MRKIFNWLIAVTLICGASVLTSCSSKEDNPGEPTVKNPERQAFEKEFSAVLQKSADQIRFDAIKQSLTSIGDFFESLDADALSNKVMEMIPEILTSTTPLRIDNLSEEDFKAVCAALNERFSLSEEEVRNLDGFLLVDANSTIGTMKVTIENGQATQSENDGFCLENIDKNGKSSSITLKFKQEHDGVRFFATRLFQSTPVCIQLPKQIDITVSTANGVQLTGTVFLDTDAPSKYISFKHSLWAGLCSLTSEYYGRHETLEGAIIHGQDRSFNINFGFGIDGVEKASLTIMGMNEPYSEEYIKSDELKSLRDCGAFFAAAYDVLKVINGKTVDNIEFSLGNLVFNAKVDDVAACLLALGNIRKMHGTKPGFKAVDEYTKILNENFHYTVSIKDTNIEAQGSLVTIMKGFEEQEYQPAVALQFAGEPQPMVLMERMTEQDMENYKKIMGSVNELAKYASDMLQKIRDKFSSSKS